jgi:hypothetical protein
LTPQELSADLKKGPGAEKVRNLSTGASEDIPAVTLSHRLQLQNKTAEEQRLLGYDDLEIEPALGK